MAQSNGSAKSLESWIWDAACSIRGAKDAPKFKDYILPLIFTKRLCDVFDDELNRIANEVGSRAKAFKLVKHDKKLVRFSEPARLSHAIEHFTSQPESQTLQFYHRIESRLRRHFSRALSDLFKIQQMRLAPQPPALPPDPITRNDETNPPTPQPATAQPLAGSQFKPVPNEYQPPSPSKLAKGDHILVLEQGPSSLPRNLGGSLL